MRCGSTRSIRTIWRPSPLRARSASHRSRCSRRSCPAATSTASASPSSPGDQQLDLKALAHLSGDKKIDTVPLKEVQPLTGYIRGGVTVLVAKKTYPVY